MKIPNGVRAIVTGGGSGLGRALCLELARKGGRVVIADINEEGAQETAARVQRLGGKGIAARCDVAVAGDLEHCAELLDEHFGGVDMVVNNAGVACAGKVGEVSLEDWQWITGINQWGVVNGCHVFAPRLRQAGRGWILNVASMAGIAALPEMAPYNVTKAAVIALSETLHTELAPANIKVTVACPTFFATNLLESFRSPASHRKFAEKAFANATISAEEVARQSLAALERGQLIVIPQRAGRVAAILKRASPRSYFRMLKRQHQARLRN